MPPADNRIADQDKGEIRVAQQAVEARVVHAVDHVLQGVARVGGIDHGAAHGEVELQHQVGGRRAGQLAERKPRIALGQQHRPLEHRRVAGEEFVGAHARGQHDGLPLSCGYNFPAARS
ncbi:MAG: hypothetical protein IPM99_06885 [Rubrivivax sp.]|nr:hypothetical protein [Rubrivivax sp.]